MWLELAAACVIQRLAAVMELGSAGQNNSTHGYTDVDYMFLFLWDLVSNNNSIPLIEFPSSHPGYTYYNTFANLGKPATIDANKLTTKPNVLLLIDRLQSYLCW